MLTSETKPDGEKFTIAAEYPFLDGGIDQNENVIHHNMAQLAVSSVKLRKTKCKNVGCSLISRDFRTTREK